MSSFCCHASSRAQATAPRLPEPPATPLFDALESVPQPQRLFLEGCICRTGLFGCCPVPVGAASAAGHGLCVPMVGLGSLGLFLAGKVLVGSARALAQLNRVAGQAEAQDRWASDVHAEATAAALPHCTEAARRMRDGARRMRRAVTDSRREQWFNVWVPGVLQGTGGLLGCATAVAAGVGVVACVAGPVLLAASGGLFAAKNAYDAYAAYAVKPLETTENPAYADAFNLHLRERQRHAVKSMAVYTGLMAGPLIGAALGASILSGGMLVAACLAALYYGSQTRFRPHTAVTSHLDVTRLVDVHERQRLFGMLHKQRDALTACHQVLRQGHSAFNRLRQQIDMLVRPSCGSTAFAAFADATQRARKPADTMAMLTYLETHAAQEITYLSGTLAAGEADLRAQEKELAGRSGLRASKLKQAWASQATRLELAHTHLSAWQQFAGELAGLQSAAKQNPISLHKGGAHAQEWTRLRVAYLQLTGSLSEALSGTAVKPSWFANHGHETWNVNQQRLKSAHHAEFLQAIAPKLDYEFARVALNPHRIEAEIDELLRPAPALQKNCDTGSCCAPTKKLK